MSLEVYNTMVYIKNTMVTTEKSASYLGNAGEVVPPKNLTPGLCKMVETEMLRACAEVAAKHGLVTEGMGLQAMDLRWNFGTCQRL